MSTLAENRPPMLEKGGYDTWKSPNEAMGIAAVTRMQTFTDLTPEEKIRKECDLKAANLILHGLPNDIYTLLNHKKIAYDIWYRVKELMEERGDGVASIKRRRRDLFNDGVWILATTSQLSNWLERLPAGSITTWEDLTTRFLAQFFPPGKTVKLRNDILMFQQHHGESLSEAWTRFKDLLKKSPSSWNRPLAQSPNFL
ncbi:zinc finger, CCHC-type containing protein [Tanacetum coccineum]